MVIKNYQFILILCIIALLSICAQCNKPRLDCANTKYSFELGIKTYPDKDSIHVGDTIWLEINEPTTLKDAISGNIVDYSGVANLGSAIGFQAFSVTESQFTINAAQKFNFFLIQGRETANTNPALFHEYLFEETGNRYLFKLGIISKETGVFRLGFTNAANVYRVNDRCTKASFSLNFKNTNQHFYFFPGGANTPPGGGTYYFKVK